MHKTSIANISATVIEKGSKSSEPMYGINKYPYLLALYSGMTFIIKKDTAIILWDIGKRSILNAVSNSNIKDDARHPSIEKR